MSGTYSARRAVGQPAVAFTRRRACDSGSALANPPELPGICSGCPLATQSASRPTIPRTAALEFCLRLRRSAGPSASAGARGPAPPVSSPNQPSRSAPIIGWRAGCSGQPGCGAAEREEERLGRMGRAHLGPWALGAKNGRAAQRRWVVWGARGGAPSRVGQ